MRRLLMPIGLVALGVTAAVWWVGLPATQAQPAAAPAANRTADEMALRQAAEAFVTAFRARDVAAVVAQWAPDGEYHGDDGSRFGGHAELTKAFTAWFAQHPQAQVEVHLDAIQFLTNDLARIEGRIRFRSHPGEPPTTTRYTNLRTRIGGRWLIAESREWSDGGGVSMQDLQWLVGDWEAKAEGQELRLSYQWTASDAFLRGRLAVREAGQEKLVSTTVIGRDPRFPGFRSWVFEAAGGFGEGEWTWDGQRWEQATQGVTADGAETTAVNLMLPLGPDAFLWQSIERTRNGQPLPNTTPVKVTRVAAGK